MLMRLNLVGALKKIEVSALREVAKTYRQPLESALIEWQKAVKRALSLKRSHGQRASLEGFSEHNMPFRRTGRLWESVFISKIKTTILRRGLKYTATFGFGGSFKQVEGKPYPVYINEKYSTKGWLDNANTFAEQRVQKAYSVMGISVRRGT